MFNAANQLETVGWLLRTLGAHEPFAAVTGDVGVGKTTVAAAAAARLTDLGYLVIRASAPYAGPLELQRLVADRLGVPADPPPTPALVAAALRDRMPSPGAPHLPVLLIDDAERLPPTVLQYLWLMHRLSNVPTPRLQVVFVGRFTFWERFAGPELDELRAQIAARCVVLPLPADEALGYVKHQLLAAGASNPVRVPRRLAEDIVVLGQGLPARLNAVVRALVKHDPVTARVTQQGVRDAAAALAGGLAAISPPRRSRRWPVALVSGVAAVVALGGATLLVVPRYPASPRVAELSALPKPPPPHTEPQRAPVAQPGAMPDPVRPAMATPPANAPPAAPPAPPAAPRPATSGGPAVEVEMLPVPADPGPTNAAPPTQPALAALPDTALLRISVQYSTADPGAAARARTVTADLRDRGYAVADPVPVAGRPRATLVEYSFIEDRDQAEQLAHELGGSAALGRVGNLRDSAPPPGTLRLMLASVAVTDARTQQP